MQKYDNVQNLPGLARKQVEEGPMGSITITVANESGKAIDTRELTHEEANAALSFISRIQMGDLSTPEEAVGMRKIYLALLHATPQ